MFGINLNSKVDLAEKNTKLTLQLLFQLGAFFIKKSFFNNFKI